MAALQVVALGVVAVGELVPDRLVVDEIRAAVAAGALTDTTTVVQRTGGVADHFGECVMLSIGIGASPGDSWFHTIATSPNLGPCPEMIDELDRGVSGLPLEGRPKIRYWNGLSAIVRPSLPLIGVNGLRTASMVALVAGVAALTWTVRRDVGDAPALGLVTPLVAATDPIGLVEVFHHPLMLAIGLAGAAAVTRVAGQGRGPAEIAIAAFAVGSVYSFVNLMNFVPGLWLMTAAIVGVCVPRGRPVIARVAGMSAVLIAWPAGYVSMWIGRWMWAAIATSPGAVADEIREQIDLRINGASEYSTGRFGSGLEANVQFWLDQSLVPVVLVVAGLVVLGAAVAVWRRDRPALATAGLVASPCVLVVPWLLVTNNHNEIHYWFEYRSLPMLSGAVLMVALAAAVGRFDRPPIA